MVSGRRGCELCHGLGQAFQKADLPRSLLFDNGSAMIAAETEQGLTRLGILFENTLPYSPYQNGKQETFGARLKGRLLPMLEGVVDLRLDQLNEATQAWIELEYNRKVHSETGQTPLQRFLKTKRGPALSVHRNSCTWPLPTKCGAPSVGSDGTLPWKAFV